MSSDQTYTTPTGRTAYKAGATTKPKKPSRRALPTVREKFFESSEPEVRAKAARRMGLLYDYNNMDSLLDAMEDPSPEVRAAANKAVVRMIGLDAHFDANGPIEKRQKIINLFRREWQGMQQSRMLREFEEKLTRHYGELPE